MIPTSHSKEKRFYPLCNLHCEDKNNAGILKKKLLPCLMCTNQMKMDWRNEAFSTQNIDLKLKTNI